MHKSSYSFTAPLLMLATSFSFQHAPQAVAAPNVAQNPLPAATVQLNAFTDQAKYTIGQPILVRLTAINVLRRNAYLRFSSGQRFDFSVFRSGQREAVYTWSASRMFIQSTGTLLLKPRQRQSFDAVIGDEMGQLKGGKYRLEARLTNSPRPIVALPIRFEVVDLSLTMTARTDKTIYKIGEPVQIEVAVANRAAGENRVFIDNGMACDIIISDEAGKPIWTYGANLRFIRILGDVTWQKGETKTYVFTWDGVPLPGDNPLTKLQTGRYRVQAVLQSLPQLYAPPVDIEITS